MLIPVILSGGTGTRLWPVSRSAYPKPFMQLAAGGWASAGRPLGDIRDHGDAARDGIRVYPDGSGDHGVSIDGVEARGARSRNRRVCRKAESRNRRGVPGLARVCVEFGHVLFS